MNVETRTVTAQFPFWEYFLPIFGKVSLQCTRGSPVTYRSIYYYSLGCSFFVRVDSAYSNFEIGFLWASAPPCWSWGTGPWGPPSPPRRRTPSSFPSVWRTMPIPSGICPELVSSCQILQNKSCKNLGCWLVGFEDTYLKSTWSLWSPQLRGGFDNKFMPNYTF